jgi:hypothetical protein
MLCGREATLVIALFSSIITFNVPSLAFAGNLASDGDILVLFEAQFKVKTRKLINY